MKACILPPILARHFPARCVTCYSKQSNQPRAWPMRHNPRSARLVDIATDSPSVRCYIGLTDWRRSDPLSLLLNFCGFTQKLLAIGRAATFGANTGRLVDKPHIDFRLLFEKRPFQI